MAKNKQKFVNKEKLNMKKSTITLIIVVLMLVAICIFAFVGNRKEKTIETVNQNKIEKSVTNEQDKNEKINEIEEEERVNEVQNNENEENIEDMSTSSETFTEEPKTVEEKAIEIVKKDWNGVDAQFSIQGMDNNGKYIVTVTDNNTTEALAFYKVNVNDGTFEKREMN